MRHIRDALAVLMLLFILTGAGYPLLVTGIAQLLYPGRANGSFLHEGGRIVGSEWIGQPFRNPARLWPRPSATPEHPYNASLSGGSNLGPLSPILERVVEGRIWELRTAPAADPTAPVPVDLVTASGSGLDPHVSPAAAFYQVGRIAAARRVDPEEIRTIIERHVESRQIGILGEPRVNVLRVNLELDRRFGHPDDD